MPKIFEYLGILIFFYSMSMNQSMFMENTIAVNVKLSFISWMGK